MKPRYDLNPDDTKSRLYQPGVSLMLTPGYHKVARQAGLDQALITTTGYFLIKADGHRWWVALFTLTAHNP